MTIAAASHFDGREMYMLHNMFRREFALMPGLVRAVAAGDHERARIVAGHIEGVATVLHHHHHSEDEHVWPLLLERVPEDLAPVVRLMESQHEEVARTAAEIDEAIAAWRGSAGPEPREALADVLDRFLPLLKEHLGVEEEHVVPLMEKHITITEWNRMVQAGAADVDPESLPLGFGMLMYEGDPEIVELAISNMPPEARSVIGPLAAQAFAAHSELIHGTPTPPRSTEL
ncbi:hemerythrin domain-containing protein [Planotetraspora mira]|uniref:Hemerythrin-like domain-containing protein n=1 Tax=Planotetraspora mira TaxID=58121 RepID=A0A8J3X5K0_9ACTN|nr:hemerythrin domain-containing protein [Planotetraspora mira]GII28251.1 hypothetical protein Pmi06nite_16930 [Planotetraspora mira]